MPMERKVMSWNIFHGQGAQGDISEHLPWPCVIEYCHGTSSMAMGHLAWPQVPPPPHLVVPPPAPPQILIRNRSTDLDARMGDGSTALILAARLAVEGMVEELIACHADVNAVDETGGCQGVGWVGIPQKFGGWGGSPWGGI